MLICCSKDLQSIFRSLAICETASVDESIYKKSIMFIVKCFLIDTVAAPPPSRIYVSNDKTFAGKPIDSAGSVAKASAQATFERIQPPTKTVNPQRGDIGDGLHNVLCNVAYVYNTTPL